MKKKTKESCMYKRGDLVVVRHDLRAGRDYAMFSGPRASQGLFCNGYMEDLAGQEVEIKAVDDGNYTLVGHDYWWSDDMFEGRVDEVAASVDQCALDEILLL